MGVGAFSTAEKIYREALLIYPNKPEMLLGLSEALAVKGETREAIRYAEKGLPFSENEKQKATLRATLCFLYLQNGEREKALALASALPHTRESREVVKPKVEACPFAEELGREIRYLILGE
jgi:tetratricopeptide (TPR) repeat protein